MCSWCEMNYVPHPIWRDAVFSVGAYHDPVLQGLLRTWKYHGVTSARQALFRLTERTIEDYAAVLPAIDAVSFVPLHKRKRNLRGFDQAEMIAVGVARVLEVPMISFVRRTRFTESQAQTDREDRDTTEFFNAFALRDSLQSVPGSVLLVDDVYTTGTTFRSAAAALEAAGTTITGLTIARG